MIVKEYKPNAKPGDTVRQSPIVKPEHALDLFWLLAKGAKEIWAPDEHGYGLVLSGDGRIIAIILEK